jgi:hypothetical protein
VVEAAPSPNRNRRHGAVERLLTKNGAAMRAID